MSGRPAARVRRVIATLLACAIIAATVYAVLNRQILQDEFAAATYDAPSSVIALEESLNLTEAGTRVFLASHPTLDGSQHFNTQCSQLQEDALGHVLGCYIDDRIHLFNVTDPRVSEIVQVTAAHELLHAAYARMRPGDRAMLAEKLRQLYEERSQEDPDLKQRMAMYEALSDAGFAGELHSVFGSEQAELPDWLEEHYAQWFTDRAGIVAGYESYRSVFQDLKHEAGTLRDQMKELRTNVEERKVSYDKELASYDADVAAFNRSGKKGSSSRDTAARQRERAALEARRVALKRTLDELQRDIDHYNEMRSQLETLGQLSTELEQQLDSALAPVTTRPTR
ncbi:hypothetical protein ACXR2W_02310 [Leucobacter sp. HY1908]